jgi:tetratricopeptide (TPR) repeat protein
MRLEKKICVAVLLIFAAGTGFAQSQQNQQASPPTPPASSQNQQSTPPPAKKPGTAADNPFPEDISRKAAGENTNPAPDGPPSSANPAAPSKTATPAGDADSSSSRSKLQGLDDLTDDNSRISNGAGGYIVNPKMAADDVKIGGFYLERRDYKGAYVRFKEATLVDPENVDAVFGLAESARGLNRKDEAVQNYRLYLDVSPDSKKAKEARKALAAMAEPSTTPQK